MKKNVLCLERSERNGYNDEHNYQKNTYTYIWFDVGTCSSGEPGFTAPIFHLVYLGQLIFWFGFISYLFLLPIVGYRIIVVKEMPEHAIPTIAILVAPCNLCIAGYLSSFQEKNMLILGLLVALSFIMFIIVMTYMPKMLKLAFYPSYSAFTFPFVITAIAMKGVNIFLMKIGNRIPSLDYIVKFLILWAVTMVLYVLIRYIIYLIKSEHGMIEKA